MFTKNGPKLETNKEPRSLIMLSGNPCFKKTCSIKRLARSSDVAVPVVLMKIDIFKNLSTTTRMASKESDKGNWTMKSIEIECQGYG